MCYDYKAQLPFVICIGVCFVPPPKLSGKIGFGGVSIFQQEHFTITNKKKQYHSRTLVWKEFTQL